MLDNYEHISGLIKQFNSGELTDKEQMELDKWINASEQNRGLFEELTNPDQFRQYLGQMEGYDEARGWQKIREQFSLPEAPVRSLVWKRIAVAASILLVVSLGIAYFVSKKPGAETKPDIAKTNDVQAPQSNRAMITLANGTKVYLDSAGNGTLATQGNVNLIKTADGKIVYSGNANEVVYNTLSNPRGSKVIDMQLADGSHVWLNAGSSITYPVAFMGNERKVSITGEAYFEVTHDASKPFSVNKGDVNVQVLGTHFNVNAYDDEEDIKVTLLEGSVKVVHKSASGILKPGQQAQVTSEVKVISVVDVEQVMAWKNGRFQFEKASLQEVMRQIARWYNVEVVYEANIPPQQFGGKMQRDLNLSEVLDGLKKSEVHFRIEGNKVTVTR